jgi:hypothetical protein
VSEGGEGRGGLLGAGECNKGHSMDGEGGTTDDGDSGGCSWKWKGGRHCKRREWTAMITRRKKGRGRGGGDDTPTDSNNDDDDDDDDNNDDDDDDKDNNNNNNNDGEDDDDNNNSTIKQCTGVRKRRKTVAAMDDGQ